MRLRWKVAAGFGVGVLIAVLALHPPLTSQDWATWIQAFGSIGAIVAAVFVVQLQAAHALKQQNDRDAEFLDRQVGAVVAELTVQVHTIRNAIRTFENAKANNIAQVFPQVTHSYPIYTSCAASVGQLADREFRDKVIHAHTEMGLMFNLLNRNSVVAAECLRFRAVEQAQALTTRAPIHEEAEAELSTMFDRVIKKGTYVVNLIETIETMYSAREQPQT